jgi:hypothetical protein
VIRPPIILRTPTLRQFAASYILDAAPTGASVEFWAEEIRTEEQSRKMHAMADDLSEQVPYMGMKLTREEWKRFATAKLKKDKIIFDCDDDGKPSANAGLIVLGAETRRARKSEMAAIIEWFYWMGAKHGVAWSDESAHPVSISDYRRG